jgi:hypothetical protein
VIADPHRSDGKRFVARANEKLTAFLELETAIRPTSVELHFLTKPALATQRSRVWRTSKSGRLKRTATFVAEKLFWSC